MNPSQREFTEAESQRHNALTKQGWSLIDGELLIEPQLPGPAGWLVKRKLHKALGLFEQALQINPEGWSSLWVMGKIYQRLGETEASLKYFGRAYRINPGQSDVAREAGLAALDLGVVDEALLFCNAAVELEPEDAGLVANLAWAYVLAGEVEKAQEAIEKAVQANPSDEISQAVRRIIGEITSGKRSRPKRLTEISEMG